MKSAELKKNMLKTGSDACEVRWRQALNNDQYEIDTPRSVNGKDGDMPRKVYLRIVKVVLDTLVAVILILALSIPMILISIGIKLTSDGPVLFRQERFGKKSEKFTLYKFRTMTTSAPEVANSEFNDMDAYLTEFGKFLRVTSLDEIPQLFNIIRGEMSFIGPRPLAETDSEVVNLRKELGADRVKPGISGLAQVNGRNNISNRRKAEYDAIYVNEVSFFNDSKILAKTVVNVFLQRDINKS